MDRVEPTSHSPITIIQGPIIPAQIAGHQISLHLPILISQFQVTLTVGSLGLFLHMGSILAMIIILELDAYFVKYTKNEDIELLIATIT